jgi:pimeloyl-ACP methyl ester carboxylesterase
MVKGSEGRSASSVFGVFKDLEADWQFRRTLEHMGEQGAEIGETLLVSKKIDGKSHESWGEEWGKLGDRLMADARKALAGRHLVSARELFLRANNMYRNGEYGTCPSNPMHRKLWEKSVHCFQEACKLFNPPIQAVKVPFEGMELPGYFMAPEEDAKKRPTLIFCGGNDSSLEELIFFAGFAAVRRGYNFFAFDHPGHRGAVHLYGEKAVRTPFFEKSFGAAIDFLQTLSGVDDRIALTGVSGGGLAVIRVAIFDKRIKALIPNSPIYDYFAMGEKFWKGIMKVPRFLLNVMLEKKLNKVPIRKAFWEFSRWIMPHREMGIKEWSAEIYRIKEYNLTDLVPRIECPVLALVGGGEGEELMRQAKEFVRMVSSKKKDLYVFSLEKDGTDDHCQLENRSRGNQIMFDWLDDLFDYRAVTAN